MESRETPYMNAQAQGERKIEVFLSNFQSKKINFREGEKKDGQSRNLSFFKSKNKVVIMCERIFETKEIICKLTLQVKVVENKSHSDP
jgi:hypothetical protein